MNKSNKDKEKEKKNKDKDKNKKDKSNGKDKPKHLSAPKKKGSDDSGAPKERRVCPVLEIC